MNVVHNFTEWNFQIVLAVSLVWTIFLLCFVAYFLMSMSEVRRENGRDVANEQQASEMTKKELTEKECRQFFGRLFEQNGNQRVLGNQDEEVSDVEMGCEESTLQSGTCAICLEKYKGGEIIVWSDDKECPHIYHKNCLVTYFSRNTNGDLQNNPCPTCRRNFCSSRIKDEDHKPQ
mmetsp:Transcript_9936/g.17762  ORF Transcript_9936/g.17762 Transcript_9936/m.17762 type:complete len:176 (-) Transcript_9936:1402-1929(-)